VTDVARYHWDVVAKRRLGVIAVVGIGAAALVGLSSAAGTSAGRDSARPDKASKTSGAQAGDRDVTSSSASQQQKLDVATYWTKERMQSAKPAVRSVPGGSPAAEPRPSVEQAAPAGTGKASTRPRRPAVEKQQASQAEVVTKSAPSGNGTDYWTEGAMDSAQPMGPTVPGDGGEPATDPSEPPVGGSPAVAP
jgi:hypothetical protein